MNEDYVGYLRVAPLGYNNEIPYAQGSAYWLSREAARLVAKSPLMKNGIIDDGAVGQALYGTVPFVHDDRYQPGPMPFARYPQKSNNIITAHKCLPEEMKRMHAMVQVEGL